VRGDRFLLAILVAIGVLVVLAVVLFYTRGGTGDYGLEDTPEGVLRRKGIINAPTVIYMIHKENLTSTNSGGHF
jgi:hypothetical protein